MTPALREMLMEKWREEAATTERRRILDIVAHGAAVGKFEAAVALTADPTMTVERATKLLAREVAA